MAERQAKNMNLLIERLNENEKFKQYVSDIKNKISHRANAVAKLAAHLKEIK